MKKQWRILDLFSFIAVAGLVSGCAASGVVSANGVTQADLDAARGAYDAAFLAPAAVYRGLPICASGQASSASAPCANAATIQKLQGADAQVEQAFDVVQNLLSNGSSQNILVQFTALTQTVAAAESLVKLLGVN